MKQQLRTVGGYSLIVIGVIGVFVPIMPTVPFLVGAAFMLGWEHRAVKPWIGYLERMKLARRPESARQDAKMLEAPSAEA